MEVAAPAPANPVQQPPGVLMKDLPGMPGTPGGLGLRVLQLLFAAVSLAVMSATSDFASVSAFCYLIAAAILQCVWSLLVAIVDIYALLVKRCLRNRRLVAFFAIGDAITCGVTFSGACAAAGITVLIDNDLNICSENHCSSFQTAVAMAFMCSFSLSPSFILNLRSFACPPRVVAAG
ncbi:CASP-like protein 5A2 [Dichanthelium oligosanthes]|uniref:CASP-like protein n=1 Tax=Dichanthelium oligosanthes TaxID=888268 RepID=A0A1E5W696_9POAL|nr:CASP-like protein 5A2 [Dichanthelium oligosanthes]